MYKYIKVAVIQWVMAAFLFTSSIYAEQSKQCLNIENFYKKNQIKTIELEKNNFFALSFIHSVSNTPVVDFYSIDKNNAITQTAERFEHHGAGLPSNALEGNAWQKEDNYFWLLMQRPISQLVIRTDKNYQNRLYIGNIENSIENALQIDLNQWQDQALHLSVMSCNKQ